MEFLDRARAGEAPPVVLVRGDLVLAEPAATKLAAALGESWGVEPVRVRQPEHLGTLVDDLRTYSLFAPGKIVVASETGLLADRDSAAQLLALVREGLPFAGGAAALAGPQREAARRLVQVLRLFEIDPTAAPPETSLAEIPDAAFGAKKRASVDELRQELTPLLAAALEAGLVGVGESEASLVADLLRGGLPERHLLILVESAVAESHPIYSALARRDAVIDAGHLAAKKRGGFAGLERLVAGLEAETGSKLGAEATAELARRTLRTDESRRGAEATIDADSAARFGAEYRKLATLAGGARIERQLVEEQVEDRGREEVWAILDAIGEGKGDVALSALTRRMRGADDPVAERLRLFALLAGFARQLVALVGALEATGARRGATSFPLFKGEIAKHLQGPIEGIEVNPLAGGSEYRLHKVYLVASRLASAQLAPLLARTLLTERQLKGDSDDPDAALLAFVLTLASLCAGRSRRASASTASARGRP